MRLFNESELNQNITLESYDNMLKYGTSRHLNSICINKNDKFDIFLSHSYTDRHLIPSLKIRLESLGYSVYVDWITDKFLSRENVNKETADILQQRMKQSKSLLFATSENSSNSKWMPWELGYFDGIKNKKVAILPIKNNQNGLDENFKGQEYLGLYCWILYDEINRDMVIKCKDNNVNLFRRWITA